MLNEYPALRSVSLKYKPVHASTIPNFKDSPLNKQLNGMGKPSEPSIVSRMLVALTDVINTQFSSVDNGTCAFRCVGGFSHTTATVVVTVGFFPRNRPSHLNITGRVGSKRSNCPEQSLSSYVQLFAFVPGAPMRSLELRCMCRTLDDFWMFLNDNIFFKFGFKFDIECFDLRRRLLR